MELKGTVKEYVARDQKGTPTHFFNVILLNHGFCAHECAFRSDEQVVRATGNKTFALRRAFVTHAFYRPKPELFAHLDVGQKQHVMSGGLLFATLDEAIAARAVDAGPMPALDDEGRWVSYLRTLYGTSSPDNNGNV